MRLTSSAGDVASCAADGCEFGYALALTPVLLSSTPPSGNEGDVLTVTGHSLSLTPSDNAVYVGGKMCEVLSAAEDTSFSPPACPVTSCTPEMRTVVSLTCRLPHLDSNAPHDVTLATVAGGYSPKLASATVTTPAQLRHVSPSSGSLAGGTLLTLYGDGFSGQMSSLDVTIGSGRCRVHSANASQITCITPVAPTAPSARRRLTSSADVDVVITTRGVAAACVAPSCTFGYSQARTLILSAATVVSAGPVQWTLALSGFFGSGDDFPTSSTDIMIGGLTPCVLTGTVSSSSLTCVSEPPHTGVQVLSMNSLSWGSALGDPVLPTIEGQNLTVSAISPSSVSLAGGATLTITGGGFSPTETSVSVCGDAGSVTSVSSTSLEFVPPTLLRHATGRQTLTLTNVADVSDVGNVGGVTQSSSGMGGLTTSLSSARPPVVLSFEGSIHLLHGATLRSAVLHVIPSAGISGAVVVDVPQHEIQPSPPHPRLYSPPTLGVASRGGACVPLPD